MRRFARLLKPIVTSALVVCLIGNLAVTANAASPKIQANVSTSPVTTNLSSGSLPKAVNSIDAGKTYYFNISSTTDNKIKKYILYMRAPGESRYYVAGSETARGYMRYTYIRLKLSKPGTYSYYWYAQYTSGKSESFRVRSINVIDKSTSYNTNTPSNNSYNSMVGKQVANTSNYKTFLDGFKGIWGQCVWYVRNRGYELLGSKGLTGIGGNAKTWAASASRKGLTVSQTPRANSIAVFTGGTYGHVIYVEYFDTNTNTVYFSEANCGNAKDGVLQKASLSNFKKHAPGGYKGCIYLG